MRKLRSGVLATILLSAIPGVALADTGQYSVRVPVDHVEVLCGETVHWTGSYLVSHRGSYDAPGPIDHTRFHVNNQNVHGVGQVTGSKYRLVYSYNEVGNSSPDGFAEYTITFIMRFIRDGKMIDSVHQYFHATFNANGDLISDFWGDATNDGDC